MKKIGIADGPTSVFVLKKNSKLTLKQKIQRMKYNMKRAYVEKTLSTQSHSMDEVIDYIKNVYEFIEADADSRDVLEEYKELRASFLIRYEPELLGEFVAIPQLKSTDDEDVKRFLERSKQRSEKAMEIPISDFDIDFHKYTKNFGDEDGEMHFIIEKKYGYIGGGVSGNKKLLKKFERLQKDIFKYFGVSKEDIETKSERYKDIVRALSR